MSQPVVFKNALVIDGTGAPPQPVPTVIVAEGAIQEVAGPSAKAPRGAQVVDLRGKYLMPGLIDAHIHAGNVELRTPLTANFPRRYMSLRLAATWRPIWSLVTPRCATRQASTRASAPPSNRGCSRDRAFS